MAYVGSQLIIGIMVFSKLLTSLWAEVDAMVLVVKERVGGGKLTTDNYMIERHC